MPPYELKDRTIQYNASTEDEHSSGRDDLYLQRLGKKPTLKRNFGLLSILGFSCTILVTWEGLLGTFTTPLTNGGSGGAVYAYIFAWIGTASCFVVLSELASMAPVSGGQYHWCAMLSPLWCSKFLSYCTGWLAVIGWQTAFASQAYLCGTEIQGVITLAHSNYHPQAWHGTMFVWCAILVALVVNMVGGKLLPRLEAVMLVVHILGFLGIIIPLTYMSNHKSAQEVFLSVQNGGNFPTQGLSWFVGSIGCVYAFAGGDAAVHMAEEVESATIAVPRAILLSVLINGSLGFGVLIAVLFCLGNIDDVLATKTGFPFMEVFYQGTASIPGAVAMCSVLLVVMACSVIGMLAATSRQFWSFARDRGVPGWRWWSRVSPQSVPTYSVFFTMGTCWLLALINIGSAVALSDVLSMAVSGVYSSYLVVSILLLYRRCRGDIVRFNDDDSIRVNAPGAKLVWGPFRVPGIWGILINGYATIFMIIVVFFSFWPVTMNPDFTTMNYTVVGVAGTLVLAIIYYFLRARKVYQGPVIESFA